MGKEGARPWSPMTLYKCHFFGTKCLLNPAIVIKMFLTFHSVSEKSIPAFVFPCLCCYHDTCFVEVKSAHVHVSIHSFHCLYTVCKSILWDNLSVNLFESRVSSPYPRGYAGYVRVARVA